MPRWNCGRGSACRPSRRSQQRARSVEPARMDVGRRDGGQRVWSGHRQRGGVHPTAGPEVWLCRDGLATSCADDVPHSGRCARATHRAHRAIHPRWRDGALAPFVPLPQLVSDRGCYDRVGLRNRGAVLGCEARAGSGDDLECADNRGRLRSRSRRRLCAGERPTLGQEGWLFPLCQRIFRSRAVGGGRCERSPCLHAAFIGRRPRTSRA